MSALLGKPGAAAPRAFAARLAWRTCRARQSPSREAAVQCPRDGSEDSARDAVDLDRGRSDHRHRWAVRRVPRRRLRHHRDPPDTGAPHSPRQRGRAFRPSEPWPRPPVARRGASPATTGNVPCAIMFLDLDGFKPVNDTFGHPKGDAVLRAVAKRLVDEVGADGHVGRMGGDEFAIVVPDAQSRKLVEILAGRIINSIKEPYMIDQTEIRIGVSIGCAFGPIDGATVDDLILKADLALYQAKDAGRGVARYFSSELQSEQEDRVRLESDLRSAIAAQAVPSGLSAVDQREDTKAHRLRGFDPLESPAARERPAQRLHRCRRGKRADGCDRRVGDRRGLPRRGDVAGTDHGRPEHQPEADPAGTSEYRQRSARPSQGTRQPHRARSHRGRVPRRQWRDPRRPEAPACARRWHRARRLRHWLFVDRLSEQGHLP